MPRDISESIALGLALLNCAEFRERIGLGPDEPAPVAVMAECCGCSAKTIERIVLIQTTRLQHHLLNEPDLRKTLLDLLPAPQRGE